MSYIQAYLALGGTAFAVTELLSPGLKTLPDLGFRAGAQPVPQAASRKGHTDKCEISEGLH